MQNLINNAINMSAPWTETINNITDDIVKVYATVNTNLTQYYNDYYLSDNNDDTYNTENSDNDNNNINNNNNNINNIQNIIDEILKNINTITNVELNEIQIYLDKIKDESLSISEIISIGKLLQEQLKCIDNNEIFININEKLIKKLICERSKNIVINNDYKQIYLDILIDTNSDQLIHFINLENCIKNDIESIINEFEINSTDKIYMIISNIQALILPVKKLHTFPILKLISYFYNMKLNECDVSKLIFNNEFEILKNITNILPVDKEKLKNIYGDKLEQNIINLNAVLISYMIETLSNHFRVKYIFSDFSK